MQFGMMSQVVQLYIDDRHNIGMIAKSSVEVTLTVADTHNCGPQEWCIEVQDLLLQLQKSNTAILGWFRCHQFEYH